jgi:hypothetical protein
MCSKLFPLWAEPTKQKGVSHTVALHFYIEKYLKGKKKNYENSNISP